jgi:enoyl-CoA hydratase/carnithine racemase
MNDRVTITMLEDGIADVRMNRPDKMNALDPAQWAALVDAIDTLKATEGLRVVVLSGEGRAQKALPITHNMSPGAGANWLCR